jgi:hypothetical protein
MIGPDLMPLAHTIIVRHCMSDSPVDKPQPGRVDVLLMDLMAELNLDRYGVIELFRRVCATMQYFADRREQGHEIPIHPFADPTVCAAASTSAIVTVDIDEEGLTADSFDPVEFEAAVARARARRAGRRRTDRARVSKTCSMSRRFLR